MATRHDKHDVIVVGASLAGCTSAILMARAGARVLLLEQRPAIDAWKVVCGHLIQSSAIPTIERLGLLEPMMQAGAVRSPLRIWFDGELIEPLPNPPPAINLPRRKLDPLIRTLAAETPGVELRLASAVTEVEIAEPGAARVRVRGADDDSYSASARLLVGADGRDSRLARRLRARTFRMRNGRFNYSPFFIGPAHPHAPATTGYFVEDQWHGVFPTSDGVTGYYLMPTLDRLPEYKRDLEAACRAEIARLPEPPDVSALELAAPIAGRINLTNTWRNPTPAGQALIGDAAQAIDPLFGVGCGWALQTGALLADAVGPVLAQGAALEPALRSYRRAVIGKIYPHTLQICGYSRGRRLNAGERFVYRRAVRDRAVAERFFGLASRNLSPLRLVFDPREVALLLRA